MRRFAGFLGVALIFAMMLSVPSRVEGRDEVKLWRCTICDDDAYAPSKSRAVVYFHAAGVNDAAPHRVSMFESHGGSGFVFTSPLDGRKRICTAWHVVRDLAVWKSGIFLALLWNMEDAAEVYVACYSETRDIAVLDFVNPDEYAGDAYELGDDAALEVGDGLVAIGAPQYHCFMESSGELIEFNKLPNGVVRLHHNAKITFGNSGGPLLNADGKVVGVNVAIFASKAHYYWSIAARANDLKDMLKREQKKKKG